MKLKFLIGLFVLTGFFVSAQSGVTIVDSIKSNGIYRTYRFYKPLSYTGSTAYPLVMNFHGYTSTASQQQFYGNFMPVADTAKFLIVHPQGTLDGSNQPYWNSGISPVGAKDLQFVSELIDTLKTKYNIDANAVYSTGMSNGGFMSNYLACNLSNKVAAIGSVAGTMFTSFSSTCNPSRPVPVIHVHGTADATVPYYGNTTEIAADSLMKYWRVHNNCGATPSFTNLPDIVPSDGCTAVRYLWTGGNSGSTNELYKVNGGELTWPGATFIIGTTNQDFNASVEIWRFFRKYKLNLLLSAEELYKKELAEINVYPNPANNKVNIASDKDMNVKVCDVLGKEIIAQSNSKTIDISELQNGIYFLNITCEGNYFVKKIVKE